MAAKKRGKGTRPGTGAAIEIRRLDRIETTMSTSNSQGA